MINKDLIKNYSKKRIIQLCGYTNMNQLLKVNQDLIVGGKAPSRKQLIKFLVG